MAKRGQRASQRVRDEVRRLAPFGRTPIEIHRELFPPGAKHDDYVASKTIQRLVRTWRDDDAETPPRWSFVSASPEDGARLLDVARWLFEASEGRRWLTQDAAAWVARLRIADPAIPPRWAWFLARAYQRTADDAAADGAVPDSRALDLTLDVAPWSGEAYHRHWLKMLHIGGLFEETDPDVLEILETLSQLAGYDFIPDADDEAG